MNISYNWLKDYIDFDLTPQQLADTLTSIGLETGSVEEVESIKGGLKGLVIGKVLTCIDHPDSDHLHITTVDLGDGQPTQIVCGAPNVAAGQTVVVATVGTTLYGPDGSSFVIKKSKIRGQESFGMICAEDEIGVGTSHDGIIVIDKEVAPGTPAADFFNIKSDWVLEVDLTPNRIDAASHYGVARDLCAWMKTHLDKGQLRLPDSTAFHPDRQDGALDVEVRDTEGCIRYCGLTIRGVKVAESPEWLRNRLSTIGLRPINNIVDITNYILMGLGQPMHCFDLAHIKGDKVVVDTVAEGTAFTTLDGVERKLSAADLMICNTQEPMCIAGVFGGLDSGVTESATDIFLESACFHPTRVRKTARRHGLSTDASFRYERGVDPNLAPVALMIAAVMVKELAGGEICGDIRDIYPAPVSPYPVRLSYEYVNALVGRVIPRPTIDKVLEALEIAVVGRPSDDEADLLVPTYRIDVRRPCDVVEDLLRIYGYNNIELTDEIHSTLNNESDSDRRHKLVNTLSNELTALGFNEILNNSLTAEAYYTNNPVYSLDACVRLLNPLSNELCLMRRTLLYGGLETLAHNINRRENDLRLYEFGNVYSYNSARIESNDPTAPYSEGSHLSLWLSGDWITPGWQHPTRPATVYDLKAVVENLLARMGLLDKVKFTTSSSPLYAACANIEIKGNAVGEFGILSREVLKPFDIKQDVFYADFDMDLIARQALRTEITFEPLPRTHPVKRDLALLLDEGVKFSEVVDVMKRTERKLLSDITLFDVYADPAHLPAGKKSYAITFTLQDKEKTLQDKQIDSVVNKIVGALRHQLGAELR